MKTPDKKLYGDVVKEYLSLGHTTFVADNNNYSCYLPDYLVIKFNASN